MNAAELAADIAAQTRRHRVIMRELRDGAHTHGTTVEGETLDLRTGEVCQLRGDYLAVHFTVLHARNHLGAELVIGTESPPFSQVYPILDLSLEGVR